MASNNGTIAPSFDPLDRSKMQVGFEVFFAVTICLVSILGNLLLAFVIYKDPQRRNITNALIHSLAWTDILMAVLQMPFWIISLYTGRWIFSNRLCEWVGVVLLAFTGVSVLNMGAIAVNRYLKVVKPNLCPTYFSSKRMVRVYFGASWLAAILLSTTPLYGWGAIRYHPHFALCTLVWEIQHVSYIIIMVGCIVIGVLCLIFYCYYKIYRTLKASSAALRFHSTQENVSNKTQINNTTQATDRKGNLLKATFTVVCVFVLCFAPVSLVALYETMFGSLPRLLSTVVTYLLFCSSGVNPFIYGVMNPRLRREFAKIIKCGKSDENAAH